MKAAFLVRTGSADKAFEIRETPTPEVKAGMVKISVEAFGLNFAEVVARRGMYQDAPKMPAILGYDVLGRIIESEDKSMIHKRVVGLSRFGGYATEVVVDKRTIIEVPETLEADKALCLGLQSLTAHFLCCEMTNVNAGDVVLIHAISGGVGIILTQLLRNKGCKIIGMTSSQSKKEFALKNGADEVFLYSKNYHHDIKSFLNGNLVDVVFNATLGDTLKKDVSLLNYGGRFIGYGAAGIEKKSGLLSLALNIGFFNLIPHFINSRSFLFLNMLRIVDVKPDWIAKNINGVKEFFQKGIIKPVGAGIFPIEKLAEAHTFLESRNAVGKIAITW